MKRTWWIIALVLVILVAGGLTYRALASGRQSATPNIQTASVERGILAATLSGAGAVRYGQSADLKWQTSGIVEKINVKPGDQVKADQELASLDSTSLSTAMINAKQTLIDAQKNLDDLLNSKVQQAQALQAVADAQKKVDDLKQTGAESSAQAQLALANAQQAVKDAQRKRNAMNYPHSSDPLVVQNAETDYLLAKDAYKEALKEFNKVDQKRLTNPDRVVALKNLLAARQKMDKAFATYNWYLLKPSDIEIAQADGDLAVAQAGLATAQSEWERLKNGPETPEIALAEAQLADAQREWERLKDGPNADDIAAAQAAVEAAQATLGQIHILAPFAGTVTDVNILPGDLVSAGTSAFRIDDLASVLVDLEVAEIDVNSVKVGQPATFTFDAAPGKEYHGEVVEIGVVGTSNQGVVNYPMTVKINDPDSSLRPGMTAAVGIVIDQRDNVLMVPNQALRAQGNQRLVTILFEGQQISVPVVVGLTNETMSEVTGDQLREGDTVLINQSSASGGNLNGGPGGFPGNALFIR